MGIVLGMRTAVLDGRFCISPVMPNLDKLEKNDPHISQIDAYFLNKSWTRVDKFHQHFVLHEYH